MDRTGLERQSQHPIGGRFRSDRAHGDGHATERPSEVDGCRPRALQPLARLVHPPHKGLCGAAFNACREDHAVRRSDADSRSAAHDQLLDRLCDLGEVREHLVALDRRKRALVEQDDSTVVGHQLDC
jgi:hypothetical protein